MILIGLKIEEEVKIYETSVISSPGMKFWK